MTGVPCARPKSVGLDHYHVSINQHMLSSTRNFCSASVCPGFDTAAPAEMSETSSRSQGGVVYGFDQQKHSEHANARLRSAVCQHI